MNVFFFVKKNFHLINETVFKQFQIILIITGLIQFFVFLFFDHQINFLDTDHYSKVSSVAIRLRGFFIEPNWYAIAISFNTFLLIGKNLSAFIKKHLTLFIVTILVMLLNGTFGTLIILLAVYGYKYLKKNFVIAFFLLIIGALTINYILEGRASIKKGKSGIELFNYGSRVRPFQKVVDYLNEQGNWKWMFGEGLGSWGTLGIENKLSVLRFEADPKFRDSSELHVFLFELGLVGTLVFFLDFLTIWFKGNREDFHLRGALLLFVAAFLLYPIFKFWMYMPYYFYVRESIIKSKPERI
ncbi:hypothetical protein [Ulvibacterium sp.]|uniref:hypothetical protein n=1 Tax=Ulvibacterium sp. TaxID=2665914 RepID=UPI0026386588|nr:hypothetical protein [Ulvibacterium sp.]